MKRAKIDVSSALEELGNNKIKWEKTERDGLDVDYAIVLPSHLADELMTQLQASVQYYDGSLTKVKVFGKLYDIPRQQVAFGDDGVSYHFSGVTLPAKPWIEPLTAIRNLICKLTGEDFNFVLVNRYRNGSDHIGEHRDGESDLDPKAPIASLSLGQPREFVLKHADCRKKGALKRKVPIIKIMLQHGSVLLMNPPTNTFWYHSLPPRKNAPGVRINLTFRKMVIK